MNGFDVLAQSNLLHSDLIEFIMTFICNLLSLKSRLLLLFLTIHLDNAVIGVEQKKKLYMILFCFFFFQQCKRTFSKKFCVLFCRFINRMKSLCGMEHMRVLTNEKCMKQADKNN